MWYQNLLVMNNRFMPLLNRNWTNDRLLVPTNIYKWPAAEDVALGIWNNRNPKFPQIWKPAIFTIIIPLNAYKCGRSQIQPLSLAVPPQHRSTCFSTVRYRMKEAGLPTGNRGLATFPTLLWHQYKMPNTWIYSFLLCRSFSGIWDRLSVVRCVLLMPLFRFHPRCWGGDSLPQPGKISKTPDWSNHRS